MTKLKDVCEFIIDCPHSTAKDEGKGYPLIRTPNIGKGRFNLEGVHRVSEDVYKQRNLRATPQDNDLIFAREAPAGNVAIIKNGAKFCLGQRTVLIRPNPQYVSPDFLTYFLLAPQQQYGLLGAANGATVAHVNLPTIRELEIDIPPIETQRRIADILSTYDDLIENNRKQIKLLEEAAQRLYKEWFVDLHFPGHEHTKIMDGVPEGWERAHLSDIADINANNIPKNYCFNYIEYTDLSAVQNGIIREKTRYALNEAPGRAKRMANDGDIIWGMVRPNLKSFALVLHPTETDVFSTGFCVLSAKKVPFTYLYYAVTTESFIKYLVNCTNGAAYPAVKPIHFSEAEIILPHEKILKRFNIVVEPMLRKRERLLLIINQASQARDRLLPKLMSGEVEV